MPITLKNNTLAKLITILLLLIPVSFKLELIPGIILYPQEVLLPFLIFFQLAFWRFKIKIFSIDMPYLFLGGGLLIIFLSSIIAQFYYLDIAGILKTLKYILYLSAILIVSKSISFLPHLIKWFNRIALLTILSTLILFILGKWETGVSWPEYMRMAVWQMEVMPTGFSNLIFSFTSGHFVKYTGNHGIYGSYLVLIYALNLGLLLDKRNGFNNKISMFLILLTLLNIGLLTSRETLIVFIICNLGFFLLYLLRRKSSLLLKISFLFFFLLLIIVLVFYGKEITIIQKINHTIAALAEGKIETNVAKRFQVWQLTLQSFALNPFSLLLGYGFNTTHYSAVLTNTANSYNLTSPQISVPESYFFTFLAYGGLIAFTLAVLFFISLILIFSKKTSRGKNLGKLLLFYVIGLSVTNNTGASVLADLLMTQTAIIFLWFHQVHKHEQ